MSRHSRSQQVPPYQPNAAGWNAQPMPYQQPPQPMAVTVARRGRMSTAEGVFHLFMTACTGGLWAVVWARRSRQLRQRWYS